jgi:uncharacterized protein (DUF58 family)
MFRSIYNPHPQFPGATPVRRKPSLDFSVTGLIYSSMMMFMGLAAINSQANLLFGVFGLMVGVLLVSGVISRMMLHRVDVERLLPETAVVGETVTINYRFINQKRFWPSLSLGLAELDGNEAFTRQPHSYLLHVAPKMMAAVPTAVVPKRRGVHVLDHYQLSTSFPFGFIKRAILRRVREVLVVFPALAAVDPRLLMLCRAAEKTGMTMRPRHGGQDEFYGVKEYQQGDNPRWIYWRRSARTGVLVSKEMTQVAPPRIVLLVDTFVPDRSEESHAAVERAIAMAASLASHALQVGISVGLVVWTGEEWAAMNPSRGKRHRRDLLAALARLPLNQSQDTQALLDNCSEYIKQGATAVLFTPRLVQMGISDQSGMLAIAVGSQQAQRWFRFAPSIDFARCIPADQDPEMERERRSRRRGWFGGFGNSSGNA